MEYIIAFLVGFSVSLAISPFLYLLSKHLKAEQTILHYVKEHTSKAGTPTFGGMIFIFGLLISSLILLSKDSTLAILTIATTVSFGILGFLDDFIKIKFKQNEGLKPYQKIIGQVGISIILAVFVYYFVGSEIYLPFTFILIDLKYFIIPFTIFVFLALVNSVNLIDGLDGLASSVSIVYILGINASLLIFFSQYSETLNIQELENIIMIGFIMVGCLVCFLCYNNFPAKIFMGDTGSLALGGFLTAITIFTKLPLLILINGFVFVVTALSDILQVGYYKWKKKRIFKMAPLHHHFQMSGIHENKIVLFYSLVTLLLSLVNIILTSVIGE